MSAVPRTAPNGQTWAEIYTQHRGAMYLVAVASLRAVRRGDADANDIVNEAFTSVMNSPPQDDVQDWRAFLNKATKNKVADYLKTAEHRISQLTPPAADGQEPDYVDPPGGEDPADVVTRRIHADLIRDRLVERITSLPTQQRRVLTLRIFESRTNAEIAVALGTTPANVSQLLKKGLSKIADLLEGLDGLDTTDLEKLRPSRHAGGAK